jgi:putative ABC transport system permease protein
LQVKNLAMRRGRFLTDPDIRATANVAVIGAGAATRLFSYEDPLGEPLLLGDGVYRVVGVLDTQDSGGATPGAASQQDFNNDIYIPLSAARRRFGELQMIRRAGSMEFERTELSEITLTVNNEALVSQTANMARKLLRAHHVGDDDYEVQVPLELLRQAEQEKRIWNLVLGSIAGISLLVGGIGIMNIMLATVTERTREIGIRRALGATRWHITSQFLVETVVLSSTGGSLGILLGILIPLAVTLLSELETAPSLFAVLLAFGISVGIGIVFGMYPARRAALMDPIEALRHE